MAQNQSSKTISYLVFLSVLLAVTLTVAGCGTTSDQQSAGSNSSTVGPQSSSDQTNETAASSSSAQTSDTSGSSATVASSHAVYKDGTYTAEGDYVSPGGDESIGVKITLKNDIIVDSEVTPEATRGISIRMQGMFTDNYKPLVIGKNIADVNLTKVSGSSLTPLGFDDALAKIKAEAKS